MEKKEQLYNIEEYTEEELYDILDLNNPTDRELEAKILYMVHTIEYKSKLYKTTDYDCKSISEYMKMNPNLMSEMSKTIRSKFVKNFTWDQRAKKLLSEIL